ncbi:MAG: hypothetical protein Q9195_007071 [Heterodermia aff. obscurata]
MTFPDGISDNVPEVFRNLPAGGDTSTSFQSLFGDDDPIDFSDIIAIAKGGPITTTKPANPNQSSESNEEHAVGSNIKESNASEDDISKMSLAGNHDDVSAVSAQSLTPTTKTNEAFNAGGNTDFNPYALNDNIHNTAVEHHKQHGLLEDNSIQSNPDLSHTEGRISSSDHFNPDDWDTMNGPMQHIAAFNKMYGQSVQYGSNSLLPHTGASDQGASTADTEPINLCDWDAVNDTIQKNAAIDSQDDQNVALSSGALLSDSETPNAVVERSSITPEITSSHNSSHYMHDAGNQAFPFLTTQPMYNDQRVQHSMLAAQRAGMNLLSQGQQLRNSMSPGRMASDDDKVNSVESPEFSSAVLPQSIYESRQSGSGSNAQYRQGSPSLYVNSQQQQPRRPQSNLRHMSVPGQPGMTFYSSANTNSGLLQQHIEGPSNSSSVTASPSMRHQQANFIAGNLAGSPFIHGSASNAMLVNDYCTKNYPGGQVIDLRGHSPASDARIQQHSLSNSPSSGRGFHTDMTPNTFQSPHQSNQTPDQKFYQNVALKHLSSLPSDYAVRPQQGFNSSMKKENSSPESASGALRKVKRDSRHVVSRRDSQGSGSQSSTVDSTDQNLINLMYEAMMDTDHTEDNPGMIKTWNGLRKETNKVRKVCEQLLETCYALEHNGAPLQTAIKTQFSYESIPHRVDELCKAFRTQKTMCKHLMEAPYIYQVVDDPKLAASRVVNNRKVNKGKKYAIEAGRNALKIANTGDLGSMMGDDAEIEHDDADGEEDDVYSRGSFRLPSSLSPSVAPVSNPKKRARPSYIGSDELVDATHYQSAAKRPKPSNSRYQVNHLGEMVDVKAPKNRRALQAAPQSHIRNRSSSVRSQSDAANGYDMTQDQRVNPDQIVNGDPTTHHGQGGFQGTEAFGGGSFGSFQGAQFGRGQQRRN